MDEVKVPRGRRSHGKKKAGVDAADLLASFGVKLLAYREDPPRHSLDNCEAQTVRIPKVEVQR